jgi:hypothetical protein
VGRLKVFALLALLALLASCDDLGCAEAEARGRGRVRRGAAVAAAGEAVDSGTADAGFVDAGDCPPDCGLLTDDYAAQLETDGYMAGLHGIVDSLTDRAALSVILVYRQPGVSGTEEIISEYEATSKAGWFYDHSTERHVAGMPADNSTPTQRANAADSGTIPTDPMIECMAIDMSQTGNASKVNWYRYVDGGTKTLGKYSVGTTMGTTIRSAADAAFGVGGRASVDGGSTVRAGVVISELIVVDGTLTSGECAEFATYSADAGPRALHPQGHSRWTSFLHWYRFGDSAGDDWYDGGTVVEDQIGANDLRVIGPIERVSWTN